MTPQKRLFDIVCALALLVVLSPLMLIIAVLILREDGRPVLYVSERMKTPDQGFLLFKFRTMSVAKADSGVSGGNKSARITRLGAQLRAKRLDELPQLFNILKGDISFVGPRPPLRMYVERFPDLYGEVLKSRPGVTGLATLVFHGYEERILATCQSAKETDAVYSRRCVPAKGRLDVIYRRNQSLCYDLRLMFATVIRSIPVRHRRQS
ncbi:sugar transferase [Primorskyibacter aestuariivivens]|uniref:sugar transferase n=1 Tax=Primorskyibacter aestuariivivens TaxID=1888912 RepID=UPI0023013F19|nr:sugar transferase [Primorskyibacter aestuariivivens]MDA7427669.1 sugar transferase [Primorskyibacter aestuariivivens]